MPLTFAHPAAIIPFRRCAPFAGGISALAIGSATPDFVYFLPLGLERGQTHTLSAIIWFCVPIGLCAWWIWHGLVKRPLFALLPAHASRCLAPFCQIDCCFQIKMIGGAAVAIAGGAFTHLVWDAFTHGFPVIPGTDGFFHATLFTVDPYRFRVFNLLQHLSTFIGGIIVIWVCVRWYCEATPASEELPVQPLSLRLRIVIPVVVILVSVIGALTAGFGVEDNLKIIARFQYFLVRALIAGVSTGVYACLAFAVLWTVFPRWRSDRS